MSKQQRFRFFVVALLGLASNAVNAQQTARSLPVTFVLKEEFSTPGLAAVIRQTGGINSEYVIALSRASLSPETIHAAVASLSRLASRFGDQKAKRAEIRLSASQRNPQLSAIDRALMNALAEQLRAAPVRETATAGRAQSFVANVAISSP